MIFVFFFLCFLFCMLFFCAFCLLLLLAQFFLALFFFFSGFHVVPPGICLGLVSWLGRGFACVNYGRLCLLSPTKARIFPQGDNDCFRARELLRPNSDQ